MRKTITTVTIGAMVLAATATLAGPPPEQKCQAAKNSAAGKYAACRQAAEKSLVSTGDVMKHGDSIAKCESKFAKAWQKATDGAASAGATCPDAPLPASDYKTLIDTQSSNIATALGGGGLTMPSTCGNGTIEAGEDCDFGTIGGATCSTVTAAAAPFGEVTCGAGCAFDDNACFPCPGRTFGGSCVLRGGDGASCTATCASAGLAYDPATASIDCLELGRTVYSDYVDFGAPWGPIVVQGISLTGIGCSDRGGPPTMYLDNVPTLGDAYGSGFYRYCACR
ncbi:MAG: hypothetical protein ABR587_14995 [Candidatus Binatia bacterium]